MILFGIHSAAEPGSTISFFKLQYQKAKPVEKPPAPTPVPSRVDTSFYILPEHVLFGEKPLAILDRTLGITDDFASVCFGGVNLSNVRLAARAANGSSIYAKAGSGLHPRDICMSTSDLPFIELEYKGNDFTIEVSDAGELPGYYVSVRKLNVPPSMDLKPADSYK